MHQNTGHLFLVRVREESPNYQTHSTAALLEAFLVSEGRPVSEDRLATIFNLPLGEIQDGLAQLQRILAIPGRGVQLLWQDRVAQLVPKLALQQAICQARRADIERHFGVLQDYLHALKLRGCQPSTVKSYNAFLRRFIKFVGKPINEIAPRDIRSFLMNEEARGNCNNSLATKIAKLRSFFAWCEREDIVDKNPMRKIDKPKENKPKPKFLTRDELELAREACSKPFEKALLEVLYGSGLRVSEAAALDWSDIDWQTKEITVRNGKGDKDRVVPMSTKAALLLFRYQEARYDKERKEAERRGVEWKPSPYVFASQFKRRMSEHSIRRWIVNLGKRAGIKTKLTPHRFRHSLATHLLESGVPIDIVKEILGHESVKTTEVYGKTQRSSVEMHYRRVIG